jgi:hypothetical protein
VEEQLLEAITPYYLEIEEVLLMEQLLQFF